MSDNTYGSHNLRLVRLNDPCGKHINLDTLFLNLYDYWTEFHHLHAIMRSMIMRNILNCLLIGRKNMKKTI